MGCTIDRCRPQGRRCRTGEWDSEKRAFPAEVVACCNVFCGWPQLLDADTFAQVRSNSLESNDSNADGQSIEEIYTKLGELDHILKRPDTFVGSTEQVTEEMTVYDEQLQLLRPKTITYVPGLYEPGTGVVCFALKFSLMNKHGIV